MHTNWQKKCKMIKSAHLHPAFGPTGSNLRDHVQSSMSKKKRKSLTNFVGPPPFPLKGHLKNIEFFFTDISPWARRVLCTPERDKMWPNAF